MNDREIERLAKTALLSRAEMANMCMAEAGYRQKWMRHMHYSGFEDLRWEGSVYACDADMKPQRKEFESDAEAEAAWKAGILVMAKTGFDRRGETHKLVCQHHFVSTDRLLCSWLTLDEILVDGMKKCLTALDRDDWKRFVTVTAAP